ncbi:MAG: putative lipopolysaccharide heptosyltransferase III [Methylobacter tundripaludum]|uniref:Heptosyltransferase-3 n=1 Tax=Methylobacter tundripaludum TaxID=173365 RepID=A0A2S6H2J3_9GAMM|nr:putative lipopolysaccharide heptosyltransferase III [Methylobacter tundripaludum]MCF7966262.1 putative lipopolysaccharide heptosyltransferase III [Methylobacter tundripaludum]PPK71647.1 heptosyltransferase-3 [Methylobacter tundripaludum]
MKNRQALQPKPKKILVIAMRYLGDVLLTTPLLHSLRQAYPDARLDVLVFRNTVAMLQGNQDINHIITTPNRPKLPDYWQLFRQLFRRYDLAVATQAGDRPFLYTLLAAPFRIAAVPPKNSTGWWKRFFVQRWTEFDDENTHTVLQHLKLLDLIDVPRCFALVPPQIGDSRQLAKQFPFLSDNTGYAVLHPHPQWTYKQWTVEGWIEVGRYLKELGLKLVLSGGSAQEEVDYVATIQRQLPEDTINLAGQVSLAQLAYIIAQAKLYIGPDTGITHLAAATGVPVIALYGPTNPVKWAPWPYGFSQNINPFHKTGCQHVNNVNLIQGEADCVPCHLEGCDRYRQSRSQCLDKLSPERVKRMAGQLLGKR